MHFLFPPPSIAGPRLCDRLEKKSGLLLLLFSPARLGPFYRDDEPADLGRRLRYFDGRDWISIGKRAWPGRIGGVRVGAAAREVQARRVTAAMMMTMLSTANSAYLSNACNGGFGCR